ncbi:hypothetical protein [Pedobacter duraquae]|uniref:DUF1292 domain-containing protein n=1 Tax=Pedobacter duraquae TaxID=425511 RepID=A0A4R6IQ61_9SPHI|nr:hypothetical protein [Pedobacter duraquae]TDO24095.1 hypothetical protein CLV32_0382 [Pedobacter duraquae]
MDPFNIKTGFGEHEVTLTILPHENGYYKVIYFGGVLGAVRYENDTDLWEVVPPEEVEAGDLPLYQDDLSGDRLKIVLDEETVDEIGEEIEQMINQK